MKLRDIYELFIREGVKEDLRSKKQIRESLKSRKSEYTKLRSLYKKFFDKDSFWNPYSDTRILWGSPKTEVRRILVGIDIGIGEMLMAEQLSRNAGKIDLVIAHHPLGAALAGLHEVMHLQTDVLNNLGIERAVAKGLMGERIEKVARGLHGINHTRVVDAAELLGVPIMCCHTPADNHVAQYLQRLVDRKKPKTLDHLVGLLLKEPEYQDAMQNKAGPQILAGKPESKSGKIFVDMTGGTEGPESVYPRMSQLGIKTILGMHLSENHFNSVKKEHTNVVIAGHMASDNLGMNLLLDKLQKSGTIEIVQCSGFRRVKR